MNTLQQKIESLLFFKNEPVNYNWLAKQLGKTLDEIKKEVKEMAENHYQNRGISIIRSDDSVSLVTSSISSKLIQGLLKKDDQKELSKQALETLAIILYRTGITKSEIDYIRGVNSVFILRNLSMRGLIQKKLNPEDKRSPLYVCTHDILSFLNVTDISNLPDFDFHQEKMNQIEKRFNEENQEE